MATLHLRLTQGDYDRASGFVVAHLRRLGKTPTSLRPLGFIAWFLFSIPVFLILTVPSHLEPFERQIIRWSVLALFVVPFLFAFGVSRVRKADARALQPLAPSVEEDLRLEVTATGLSAFTDAMQASYPWSAVSILVLEPQFSILFVPRASPFPVPLSSSVSESDYYTFIRHAQQYKAASAG